MLKNLSLLLLSFLLVIGITACFDDDEAADAPEIVEDTIILNIDGAGEEKFSDLPVYPFSTFSSSIPQIKVIYDNSSEMTFNMVITADSAGTYTVETQKAALTYRNNSTSKVYTATAGSVTLLEVGDKVRGTLTLQCTLVDGAETINMEGSFDVQNKPFAD